MGDPTKSPEEYRRSQDPYRLPLPAWWYLPPRAWLTGGPSDG